MASALVSKGLPNLAFPFSVIPWLNKLLKHPEGDSALLLVDLHIYSYSRFVSKLLLGGVKSLVNPARGRPCNTF